MEIAPIIVLILSIFAIISAIITVTHKEPIKCAMALIFNFFMLAGIYLTLSAEFIAVVQIIVYAGAIMVLVLFVIMLLNIGDEESAKKRKNRIKQYFSVTISTALLVLIISYIVLANTDYQYHNASIFNTLTQQSGSVKAVGEELFTNFLIPLEAVGILLLTAIIGSVILAKKRLN